MPDYMPPRAAKTINSFLQVLAKLKADPTLNTKIQQYLPELEQRLTQTANDPLDLAICIKEWCSHHQIDIAKLKTRLEIGEDDDTDTTLEGESVDCVINKTMIIQAIQNSKPDQPSV